MNNQNRKLPDPFDSFVVGSLPRPKWVMEVVERRKNGDISDANFQSILDTAVPFAITLQEKAGLDYITDGEWRRESYVKVFSDSVDGFKNDLIGVGTVNQDSHTTNMYPAVVNKIKQVKSIALNEAKFTTNHSLGRSKLLVTLPSAYTVGRRMWDEKFSSEAYPERSEFIEDCVPIIRNEITNLMNAGFLNIQLDDPWLALLVDPEYRKREKISDIDKEIELSVKSTNKIVEGFNKGDSRCIESLQNYVDHLARGLSSIVNTLDPDIIVLGGGMSNIEYIYDNINKELKNTDLPEEIRIGAILRNEDIIIPRSNFVFKKDDIVVFLAKRDQLSVVENMFRISSF